ncbi:MAG: hypothetical protein HKN43_08690 [Rhodothermales bacterium]|nr:hypothetical protein [Rhodothermales bacterium]
MPQTIGAFLALSTVMMFSLNYQQTAIQSNMSAVNSEMEVMANAVAAETMQYISSKPFDSNTSNDTVTEKNAVSALLTNPIAFGRDGGFADAMDIDDFHGMEPDSVWFPVTDSDGFNFTVKATVRYIDDYGTESQVPTWLKEVTLTVDGPENNGHKLLFHPVSVTRQFSPQWY